jgi:hypothetical protein
VKQYVCTGAGRHFHRSLLAWAGVAWLNFEESMPPPSNTRATAPKAPAVTALETATRDSPTVVYQTEGFVMATWKNLALHMWSVPATPALAAKLDEYSAPFVALHSNGVSAIHVIARDTPLPNSEVRELLRGITNKYAKSLACVCHVVEGSGFWASALQSFLTGLHFASRAPFELYICSTVAAAARRVAEPHARRTGVSFTVQDLETSLEAFRRRGA